jgi:hypothetical protein
MWAPFGDSVCNKVVHGSFFCNTIEYRVESLQRPVEQLPGVVRLLISPVDLLVNNFELLKLHAQLVWVSLLVGEHLQLPGTLVDVQLQRARALQLLAENVLENGLVQL